MITITYDGGRYMRYFGAAYGEPAPLIAGLINMLDHIEAEGRTAIEIGSFAGESSEIIAQYVSKLDCIDPWVHADVDAKTSGTLPQFGPAEHIEKLFDGKMARFSHVTKHKAFSQDIVDQFEDESVYMLYIDGWHTRPEVVKDIRLYVPKVQSGGWVCGHDYSKKIHPGVYDAVQECFGDPVKVFADSSWIARKESLICKDS